MLIYIVCIIVSYLFAYMAKRAKGNRKKMSFLIVSIMIPTLVAGFRYNNGTDYNLYTNIFNTIRGGNTFYSVKSIEVGFVVLVKAALIFSKSPVFMFLLCAAVINTFYYIGSLKMSANLSFSILLFFITGTFFDSFNGLRQYIAAAIIFFSYQYLLNNETKKYVVCILVATLFHYSALIMLPLYFVFKQRFSLKKTIIIISMVLFGGSYVLEIATNLLRFTRYSYFIGSVEYKVIVTAASILYTSIITVFFTYQMVKRKHIITDRQKQLYSIQVVILLAALSSLFIPLSARLQYYFLPMEMIVVPEIVAIAPKRTKRIIKCVLATMYIVIVGYGMLFNNWYDCLPYNFYFS